ncbi:MAG: hypothetical protein JXA73_13850 [Acidobacteria bacterium]|nr:hypothetical protein [Acidobacteriota bacterium]
MKSFLSGSRFILVLIIILIGTVGAPAQEQSTEIQGFYQTYKDFSFKTGITDLEIKNTRLGGGGFTIAQNLAPWFAFFSQTTFYGSPEQDDFKIRVINNLEGLRWQTGKRGPFQFYVKAGLGFTHYSMKVQSTDVGGEYKFAVSYGGGAFIWMSEKFGLVLDASHLSMGVPNLTDLEGRDKWDSGLSLTTGFALRF